MRDGANVLAHGACETIIKVSLGERSYPIALGDALLADAGQWIAASLPGARCAVVTDQNVAALHLAPLKASLEDKGLFLGDAVVAADCRFQAGVVGESAQIGSNERLDDL